VWAFTKKKNYLETMGRLPLDGGETNPADKI
jgi:hypothetical protein